MAELKVEMQKLPNGVILVKPRGFLDAYTYGDFEQTINSLFNEKMYRLIVDMSAVDYISSAGAGVFIASIGVAQENQGNIVIVRPKPAIKEVFDLLGLSQIFVITDNMEKALLSLA
ncbi:MAG: STAS domain-containing protein [Planctomycetota bacterium]|nr:STAS domain-containing protein [Planctomycetota bacterium]MDI6787295.1 STAS domain-containing protein [Planctomycetota bacterium]